MCKFRLKVANYKHETAKGILHRQLVALPTFDVFLSLITWNSKEKFRKLNVQKNHSSLISKSRNPLLFFVIMSFMRKLSRYNPESSLPPLARLEYFRSTLPRALRGPEPPRRALLQGQRKRDRRGCREQGEQQRVVFCCCCSVDFKILSITKRENAINFGQTEIEQAIVQEALSICANVHVPKQGQLGSWADHCWAEKEQVYCHVQLTHDKLYVGFL